ncbi:MAG: SpoIIE family protein phosphatase [Lachnospiraceae bacterium]|nr:SpoIIE family protein phosphatase [Lachnospiraceae bacterium]
MRKTKTAKKTGSIKKRVRRVIIGGGFGIAALQLLLIFALLGWLGYSIHGDFLRRTNAISEKTSDALEKLDEATAGNYANLCEGYINEYFGDVRQQAQLVAKEMATGPSDRQIGILLSNLPDYDPQDPSGLSMYVVTKTGRVITTPEAALDDNGKDPRESRWYIKAEKQDKPYYWSNVVQGVLSDAEKVVCACPYVDARGNFAGVVAAGIEMGSIPKKIAEMDQAAAISLVLFDGRGRLMYAPGSFEDADYAASLLGKEDFSTKDNDSYTLRTMPETGWTLCVVQDRAGQEGIIHGIRTDFSGYIDKLKDSIRTSLLWSLGCCIAFLCIGAWVLLGVGKSLSDSLTGPIVRMTEQVEKIGGGDLSLQVDVTTDDEIGRLGESFNHMTAELRERIDHIRSISTEKERMETERSLVRQLVQNMLPNVFPAFPDRKDFDIYASLLPADEGGGSFYDFFFIDKKTFCIAIGEASGAGIPSTLFSIVAKTNIKSYAQQGYSPDRILAETNNQLAYGNDEGTVAHIFAGIVNLSNGDMEYACAGEAPVLWKHSGEAAKQLPGEAGVTLGNMENVPYTKHRVRLSQGDLLFAHTRDTAECTDAHGNSYTAEYLYEKWGECAKKEYRLPQLVEALNDEIKTYTKGVKQKEDVTMLMFRYWG